MDQSPHTSYAVPHLAGPVLRRAGAEVHWLWFGAIFAAHLLTSALFLIGQAAFSFSGLGIQEYSLLYTGINGLAFGAMQWLALRRYAPISWVWVPATIAAGVAANALAYAVGLEELLGALPAVLAVAASQALVLSRRLRGAGLWLVAASAAAFLSGLIFSQLAQPFVDQFGIDRIWIFSLSTNAASALIYAVIEGAALRRLLRDNATRAPAAFG